MLQKANWHKDAATSEAPWRYKYLSEFSFSPSTPLHSCKARVTWCSVFCKHKTLSPTPPYEFPLPWLPCSTWTTPHASLMHLIKPRSPFFTRDRWWEGICWERSSRAPKWQPFLGEAPGTHPKEQSLRENNRGLGNKANLIRLHSGGHFLLQLQCGKVYFWPCHRSNFHKNLSKLSSLTLNPGCSAFRNSNARQIKKISRTRELNRLFMEGIILCGQPGRSFEVGKATGFLAPAGLFLASKFAANSVVQDISKSFMFLAFPLAHHNFFPTFVLKVPGLLPCPQPTPGLWYGFTMWESDFFWNLPDWF